MIYGIDELRSSPTCLFFSKYGLRVSYLELIEIILYNLCHSSSY